MLQYLIHFSPYFQQDENFFSFVASICGVGIGLAVGIVILIANWKIFTKAGKPGWAVLIPIYNAYILLEIVGREWWWLILLAIPGINLIFLIILLFDLAKSFGKGADFGFGLLFLSPIFIAILGFGDAQYVGPSASQY
ncbi:MAG: DUF5684 domain-containing protein [Thermodesulfobacteriota bacterium]|nr:DUF5684 domain-containing protein [Thermodesulfobacteriota bacterium]